MELLTSAQMRAIEQAAIDSGEVTGLELMERAGRGVVEAIFEWRPELAEGDRRAVVLCGPGNNGGDGFVVARLLKERGWAVEVFLYGDETKLPPDAAENARRWRVMGEIRSASDLRADYAVLDLAIDALFGTGISRRVEGDAALASSIIRGIANEADGHVVAIDTPSGICMDSGRLLVAEDKLCRADLTVTFHAPTLGHFLSTSPDKCCVLVVSDIGINRRLSRLAIEGYDPASGRARNRHAGVSLAFCEQAVDKGAYETTEHKYDHGHTLIVSGGMAQTGAARLAARGALRVGAGLVTVASPPDALMENAAHLTAIMLRKMKGAEGLREILSDERINAVVIGPGCGVGEETRALVQAALGLSAAPDAMRHEVTPRGSGASAGGERPRTSGAPLRAAQHPGQRSIVLDADALTSFADNPEELFGAIKASPCTAILTPHGGEFARLFPDIAAKLAETPTKGPAYSKVDATREAAARSGATVLYKGADTVIADPNGRCSIAAAVYERAAPWLATAGSGDVLAGMIAGLAARGHSDPAASAAWLHQECGRHIGPGLIAEDIPEAIPAVLKRLLEWKAE